MRWKILVILLTTILLVGVVSGATSTINPVWKAAIVNETYIDTFSNVVSNTVGEKIWQGSSDTLTNNIEIDCAGSGQTNKFTYLTRQIITFPNMSSSLPAGSTITSAYLQFEDQSHENTIGLSPYAYLVLVAGTPSNPISIVKSDYHTFSTTPLSSTNYSTTTPPAIVTFPLNSNGISFLSSPNVGIYNVFYLLIEDDRANSFSGTWGADKYALYNTKYFRLVVTYSTVSIPVASFTKDKTDGTNPLTVTFTDTSTNTPTSWHWDFGDGDSTNHTVQNPVHTYTSAGEFHVNHEATNSAGTDESDEQTITVGDAPSASFTKNVTYGTIPFYVAFTSTSSGSGTKSYYWVFGDGSISTSANPTHQFTSVGSYATNVTVTTSYGTSQSGTQTITANQIPAPTASFTKDKTNGAAPLTVQFTDTSTGSPTSWYWVFGDGATSTSASPSHQYTTGTYSVNLTATNDGGSSTTATQEITVGTPPTSSFTILQDMGATPFTATFTFTGVGADSYLWNFGDSSTTNNTAQNPVHTFSSNGDFVVHVTATNTYGSTQSPDGTIHTGSAPVASFTKDKTSGAVPLDVQFTSTSTGASSYYWVFGDGSTSTLQNPSHQYASVGSFNANLTVYNTYAQSTSGTQGITVGAPPTATFTKNNAIGSVPLQVQFTSTSTGADSYYWVYGDGSTSTEENPVHTFSYAGIYTTNLTTTNTYGSTQSATQTIDVGIAPSGDNWNWNPAQFAYTIPSGVEVNKPITFTWTNSTSATPPFTFAWNAIAPNGTHIHSWSTSNPATFTPDVVGDWRFSNVVTNVYGSSTETDYWWTIRYPYNLSVSATPSSAGIPYTTTYTVTNVGGNTMSTYLWVGEDGWTSTSASPTRSITTAGSHTANVTVYFNALGVKNTSQVNTVTGLTPPTNVLWTANITEGTAQTTTASRFVKFIPSFDGTHTGINYSWSIHGQNNYANGQVSSADSEPVLEIESYSGGSRIGYGWVNLTVTTDAGVGVYNHTYNVDGLKPKVGSITPNAASGTLYPMDDVRYFITFDATNGAFPYNISVNYGDGSMYYNGQVVPTSSPSQLTPAFTTPSHNYASAGSYTVSVIGTNIWGVSNTFSQTYTIIPIPATPAATMRWSKQDGTTITSSYAGEQVYYTFNTVSNGRDPPYVGQDMDVFYIRLFKLDPATNSYIEQPQPQGLITQMYGALSYNTNSPITLTSSNVNPYYGYDASGMTAITFSGSNWTGSVPYTPTTAGTYRMYLVGVSLDPYDTIDTYYTYGYKDLSVVAKPIDVAKTGDWATNFGGEAFKMVIAVIVMIAAIGVPFAITREFNPYVEIVAAILGIGACYMAGLIPIWVIIGMVIIGAIVIFFMSRGGGAGGDTGGEVVG